MRRHMQMIAPGIFTVPAEETPLSSDIFLIEGEKGEYLFDVGAGAGALNAILNAGREKERCIILSHYHDDHTANLAQIEYDRLLVGELTQRHLGVGEIVREPVSMDDGVHLEIRPCFSPHSGGSLILTVNREYTLLGDLIYPEKKLNRVFARLMTEELEALDTKYFILSHRPGKNVLPKQVLIPFLKHKFA